MAEDKSVAVTEEKRYAILTRESIRTCAEAGGHSDIPEDVAGMLGEDVSYRLRAIAQLGAQFMRHSRRRRMTTEDVNKALRNINVQPVFGHGSMNALPFQHTREGEIHFVEDPEVSLTNIATNNYVPKYNGKTSIKAHWLALEGVQKTSSSQQQQQSQNPTQPGNPLAKPGLKIVTEEHLLYYDNITKAILGYDEQLAKVALEDLKTNSKLVPLLPYFVNFVSNGVKTISYDIKQLTKLLHTVKALIVNPHLYLEPKPYLTLLVQSVMYCTLEPLAASINPLNDHWVLRDYAARLLAQIIYRWQTPVNQLFQSSLRSLREALQDLTKPSCSHYGAVMGLLPLGINVVEEVLIPVLPTFWPHLQSILEDTSAANSIAKSDAHKVHGAILLAVELVMKKKLKDFETDFSSTSVHTNTKEDINKTEASEVNKAPGLKQEESNVPIKQEFPNLDKKPTKTPKEINLKDFYMSMYEYFGDSLSMRLPELSLQHIFKPSKKETIVKLQDPEIEEKSGEDLLADFMEQVRLQQIREEEERKVREEQERKDAIERQKRLIRQREIQRVEEERRRKEAEIRNLQEAEIFRKQEERIRIDEDWHHSEQRRQHDDLLRRRYAMQQKAGVIRTLSRTPLLHSAELSDQEEEQDVDVEEMSDRSPESEKSEEEAAYRTTSPMAASVKSTVSDPHKGIKLTIKLDRSEKSEKHKEKDYKHSRKRKQSGRSPRESSHSPWDSDRYDTSDVYQFDAMENKSKASGLKRPSQRDSDDYELVDDERTHSQPKITLKLSKAKLKGASTSHGSPSYS